jgi:alkanesulfonate monooxygenase SsuD/methylene tetrahydromethanopterin reductase-like flavin-dependent oxidoreductase (luciferase family)
MSQRGTPIAVPPVERALRHLQEAEEPAPLPERRMVLGSPETVRAGLETIAGEYGADEVIVVTVTHSHAARTRSYELIAEAFGLRRRRPDRADLSAAGTVPTTGGIGRL